MTTLRPTAIGSFAEHRWPVWVIEASVVLKKFMGVVLMANTGDSKPPALSSNLSTYAN